MEHCDKHRDISPWLKFGSGEVPQSRQCIWKTMKQNSHLLCETLKLWLAGSCKSCSSQLLGNFRKSFNEISWNLRIWKFFGLQSCQQSWEFLLRLAKGEIDSPLSHALKKLFDIVWHDSTKNLTQDSRIIANHSDKCSNCCIDHDIIVWLQAGKRVSKTVVDSQALVEPLTFTSSLRCTNELIHWPTKSWELKMMVLWFGHSTSDEGESSRFHARNSDSEDTLGWS